MRADKSTFPGKSSRSVLHRWTILLLVMTGLLLFMFVIGPAGLKTPLLEPMATFIEENDINANAYYYSDVDEFFLAERHMRDHLGYLAGGGH